MKKKWLVLLLTVAMLGTLLTGCGEDSSTGVATETPAASPSASTVPVASGQPAASDDPAADKSSFQGTIEITLSTGDFMKYMREFVKPYFEAEYPNVTLKITAEGSWDGFVARIAANDLPNIYASTMGGPYMKLQKMGKLVNVKEFADADTVLSQVDPVFTPEIQGGIYNIPWVATTQMMVYNKDLFREAGLDPDKPPETFDEFLEYAALIDALPNRPDGSEVYGTCIWNDALDWGSWYWACMAQVYYNFNDGKYKLFNEEGTDIVFDKPESGFKDFMNFMVEAQKYAPRQYSQFYDRNVGMFLQHGYGWKNNLMTARDQPMVVGEDVGIAPIPVPEAGMTHWSTMDGRNLVVFNKNEKDNALAWELVKYLMRPEVNLEACKMIGQLPLIDSLKTDPFFAKEGEIEFVEQAKNTVLLDSNIYADQVINQILSLYKQSVVEGSLTVDEAVLQMADKAREIIQAGQDTAN